MFTQVSKPIVKGGFENENAYSVEFHHNISGSYRSLCPGRSRSGVDEPKSV
jgi:hypothetical protein